MTDPSDNDDRLSRPLGSAGDLGAAASGQAAEFTEAERLEAERLAARVFGEDGAASRGLGGPGGDDAGSSLAGLGGLRPPEGSGGAGGLDARNQGGGGLGMGQTQGVARQNQAFGLGGEQVQSPTAGGLNEQQDELRAQGQAQGATDASDAQGLLDKTRAQTDLPGADRNNDSL
jgi:hypothetical protein